MTNRSSRKSTASPLRIAALVYDGLCTFEYGIAAEVFALPRPELGQDLYQFSSVAIEKGSLLAAGGLKFNATGTLKDLQKAHTIIIPGWRGKDQPVPERICEHLRRAHQRGARLVSICSGGYVLAAAGLLDSKRATTHWQYADDFRARFPDIIVHENELYVDEGDVVTSAGSSAGIDACLHIVRCDYGAKVANMVARRLVMHSHRQGSQSQFIEQPIPKTGNRDSISTLMERVRADLSTQHQISSMAKLAAMSERTFQRRFIATTGIPAIQWLTQERISRACQLLETTEASVDGISEAVGFNNTDAMRYHFRTSLGLSPKEYRKRFIARA